MRDIKFRGKRLDSNEWVYGYLCENLERQLCIQAITERTIDGFAAPHICYPIDPATIGQFTGLFDKNEQDIYEGDIIDIYDFYSESIGKFEVGYNINNTDYPAFDLAGYYEDYEVNGLHDMVYNSDYSSYKVTGSIHDNTHII